MRLLFRPVLVEHIFQRNIDEIFIKVSNVTGIIDDMLFAGVAKMAQTVIQHYTGYSRHMYKKLHKDVSFNMHHCPILLGNYIKVLGTT